MEVFILFVLIVVANALCCAIGYGIGYYKGCERFIKGIVIEAIEIEKDKEKDDAKGDSAED